MSWWRHALWVFAVALTAISLPASAQPDQADRGARAAVPETVPLPPPRPKPEVGAGPQNAGADPAKTASAASDDQACLARLSLLGVRYETRPPVEERGCQVRDAVLVSHMPGGVMLTPPSLMTCTLAEALARWTVDHVSPEAQRHLGSAPQSMRIGTGYQCRSQRSGTKLSEHAFGNAVDVMGFTFATRSALNITAYSGESPEAAFQAAIRKAACDGFSTVLGPGADADHSDHLHLDRRGRNRGFRICQ